MAKSGVRPERARRGRDGVDRGLTQEPRVARVLGVLGSKMAILDSCLWGNRPKGGVMGSMPKGFLTSVMGELDLRITPRTKGSRRK
jgi:hypothetical protein